MLQSLFFCKRVRFKTVFLEITILSITLALNARHMHEAYLMGIPIAIQSQETVRIAIRGCGEVLLSIRVWRGVGSMVRCGMWQHPRANDNDWRLYYPRLL